jgi:ribosomal protein S18 acetylase RimI-like enzyme
MADTVELRPATPADTDDVADIWHRGWRDGHLGNVPESLLAIRTPGSFRERAAARIPDTTIAVRDGQVAGFVMVDGDEVEQVYVAAAHRGSGVAQRLLTEAERQVAAGGHRTAWLAVVAGNARARRFYERCGWSDGGAVEYAAEAPDGTIAVPALRYVKQVAPEVSR